MEYFRSLGNPSIRCGPSCEPPDKMYFPQCTCRRKFIVHAIRLLDRPTLGKRFAMGYRPSEYSMVSLRAQYPLRKEATTIGFAVTGGKVRTAGYNEFRNVNNSCFSSSVSSLKRRDTCSASPLCRSMAFSRVKDRRSCM